MAAKAAKNTKQQRRTGSEKHKVQAGMAVEKRAKGVKGRNVKARLEQLTAELDMRTAEVQNAYMTTTPSRDVAVPMETHAPVGDLAEALRGL